MSGPGAFNESNNKPISNSELQRNLIRENQLNKTQTFFHSKSHKDGADLEPPGVPIEQVISEINPHL